MSRRRSGARGRAGLCVLGAGRFGTTLAVCAARKGHPVWLWCERPERLAALRDQRRHPELPELERLDDGVVPTGDLAVAAAHADTLLIAVPATELRALCLRLGEVADPSHLVLHAVRGLEPGTLERPSRLIRHQTALRKVGAILGPALVGELLAGRPNALVVASRYPEAAERAVELLASDALRIYSSADLVGVEVASASAAVGALALGIALELRLGPATMATLQTRAAAELARVVAAAGGKPASAYGLAGLGALLALRESEGREVAAGRALARGEGLGAVRAEVGELDALDIAQAFVALADRLGVQAHIAQAVAAIVRGELPAGEGVRRLMLLDAMIE
jgi:glycerol-3-phosphate dehydrogenase (NAD(P)+)